MSEEDSPPQPVSLQTFRHERMYWQDLTNRACGAAEMGGAIRHRRPPSWHGEAFTLASSYATVQAVMQQVLPAVLTAITQFLAV
jgi:hypothetical protein